MKVKKIQTWYNLLSVAAVAILLITTFSKCGGGSGLTNILKDLVPNTEVVLRIDTVTVFEKVVVVEVDSFYQKEIVYLDRWIVTKPDTVYLSGQDTISRYAGELEDSTVVIDYAIETTGELQEFRVGYKLKPPSSIERTITETVTETNTITKEVYRGGLYIGSGVRYEPNILKPILTTDLGYLTRKGWYFGYSFEPTTKSHKLNFKRRIF